MYRSLIYFNMLFEYVNCVSSTLRWWHVSYGIYIPWRNSRFYIYPKFNTCAFIYSVTLSEQGHIFVKETKTHPGRNEGEKSLFSTTEGPVESTFKGWVPTSEVICSWRGEFSRSWLQMIEWVFQGETVYRFSKSRTGSQAFSNPDNERKGGTGTIIFYPGTQVALMLKQDFSSHFCFFRCKLWIGNIVFNEVKLHNIDKQLIQTLQKRPWIENCSNIIS